jgi:hypothetical protein
MTWTYPLYRKMPGNETRWNLERDRDRKKRTYCGAFMRSRKIWAFRDGKLKAREPALRSGLSAGAIGWNTREDRWC